MKIIHLIYDNPANPWLGGGGAYRAEIINNKLRALGHEVIQVSGGYPGAKSSEVQLYTPKSKSYLGSRILYSIFAAFKAYQQKPDFIIDDTSCYSPTFSFCFRLPKLAIMHHLNGDSAIQKFPFWGKGIQWLEILNLKRFKNWITVSPSGAKELLKRQFPREGIHVLPAGIEVINDNDILPFNERKCQILILGRIEIFNKGLDFALDILSAIPEQWGVNIVVAGGGKDSEEFEKCSRNIRGVRYLGRVSEIEKRQLLKESRVLLMPSRYEGWGMVATEAMAWGTPVLASDIDGLREAIQSPLNSPLLAFGNCEEWLEMLNRVLFDKDIWSSYSLRARSRAKELNWDSVVEKQLKLMEEIRGKNGSI